ncbi:MAG: hypothetical protein IKY10_03170, partial [Clostridia bacterium]|nr:hypothetical protein [Clostridia bacterium]
IIANKRGAIRDEDGNMILKKVDADGTKHYKSGKIGGGHLQTVANLQEKLDAYEGNAKSMKYQERSLEPIIRAFRESQASSNVKTFATQMGIDISDVSLRNFEEAMTRAIRNNMFVGNGDNARLLNKNALMTRLTEREKFTGEEVAKASESVAKAMQKFNDMLTYNAADNALHDAVESLTKDVMDSAKKLKIDKELDISGLEKSLKDASKTISETFDKLKKFEDIK